MAYSFTRSKSNIIIRLVQYAHCRRMCFGEWWRMDNGEWSMVNGNTDKDSLPMANRRLIATALQ